MTARYNSRARLAPMAVMAMATMVALAACGSDDVPREPVDTPAYDEVGRTPPSMVAAPEPADTADEDGVADPGTSPQPGSGTTPAPAPGTAPGTSPGTSPATSPATTPAAAETASTDAILRATARRYEQVRSLRAEFEQRMQNPLLGRETVSRGTLYQRQPDRFLMQFSDPDGDIIVSDGEFFWLYYPSVDARQVIRAPRGPQGMDLHAQFIGDPVSRFEATSHGRESVQGRPANVLTLVPRQPLGYRSLKVWIDVEDNLVRRFELTEENRNVRRFELRDVVVNPSLPDRLFQFTPPAGAQVIQR